MGPAHGAWLRLLLRRYITAVARVLRSRQGQAACGALCASAVATAVLLRREQQQPTDIDAWERFLATLAALLGREQTPTDYDAWAGEAAQNAELVAMVQHAELVHTQIDLGKPPKNVRFFIRNTLLGRGKIERLHIWWCPPEQGKGPLGEGELAGLTKLRALFQLGSHLCGHPEYIHGGFLSGVLDEMFGWTAYREKEMQQLGGEGVKIFTANLSVNYRKPVPRSSLCLVECWVQKVVRRRKIYIEGAIRDREGAVLVDSTCLYIVKAFGAAPS